MATWLLGALGTPAPTRGSSLASECNASDGGSRESLGCNCCDLSSIRFPAALSSNVFAALFRSSAARDEAMCSSDHQRQDENILHFKCVNVLRNAKENGMSSARKQSESWRFESTYASMHTQENENCSDARTSKHTNQANKRLFSPKGHPHHTWQLPQRSPVLGAFARRLHEESS